MVTVHKSWRECIDNNIPWNERTSGSYRFVEEAYTLGDVAGRPLEIGDRVAWVTGSGTNKKLAIGILVEVRESRDNEYYHVDIVCRSPEYTRDSILTRGFYSKVKDGILCWNQIVKLPNE